jgi:flagellar protein FliO/FliZ
MILALVVVLLTIFAIAWLLRRLKSLPDARQSLLRSEAELAVGEKERVVLLAMGSRRWLLGVTPGGISVLQALDNDPVATGESSALNLGSAGAAAPASFATVLRRSLGMAP